MKKLFLFSVAALAFCACSSDETVSENNVANQQPKEISFSPLAKPNTRAAVDGTVFPTTSDMQVAAYDVTNTRDFFTGTQFIYKGIDDAAGGSKPIWTGGKYWPLSPAYINFLAYANVTGTAEFGDQLSSPVASASKAVITQTDNSTAQTDLMYAIGNGQVTQSGNTLTFPENVTMTFKHAQAWIRFMADAYDATTGGKITLNSITLNGAHYSGTFTVTHTNYDQSSSQSVSGSWSALGLTQNLTVPNWSSAAVAYDSSSDGVYVGDGLLIVPDDNSSTADWESFTIAYTLDGKSYSFTYAPTAASDRNVDQAKKYTFKINFHLHEIEIAPDVTDWVEGSPAPVPVF